jgi:hypothetical protein
LNTFSRSCFVISSFIVFYWLDMEMKIGGNRSVWGEGGVAFFFSLVLFREDGEGNSFLGRGGHFG